ISHHMDDPVLMEQYARITTWHVEQYAYFLEKLKSIKEGDKTLLDNSMITFVSGLRDGNRHSPRNVPWSLPERRVVNLRPGNTSSMKRIRRWRTFTCRCCMH